MLKGKNSLMRRSKTSPIFYCFKILNNSCVVNQAIKLVFVNRNEQKLFTPNKVKSERNNYCF